jgi:hypothetical protein
MGNTTLQVVPGPELVQVNNRAVAIRGWRQDNAVEHLHWHLEQPSEKWCSVECMARTMFQRNTLANRDRVRKRASRLLRYLIGRRELLCIEYATDKKERGRIKAMKIFESNVSEVEYARHQIEMMKRRGHLAQELVEQAIALTGIVK